MENASKALIMAGEILLGVMIISVGVYIFNMFADYSSDSYDEISSAQIAEFNAKFLIYYGNNKDGTPIECTIHDIAGLANLAQKYNLENELIEKTEGTNGNNTYQIKSGINTKNSLYIQIDLGSTKNLELKSEKYIVDLIKKNDLEADDDLDGKISKVKYYKCTKCESYSGNKRINYVKFEEM